MKWLQFIFYNNVLSRDKLVRKINLFPPKYLILPSDDRYALTYLFTI